MVPDDSIVRIKPCIYGNDTVIVMR